MLVPIGIIFLNKFNRADRTISNTTPNSFSGISVSRGGKSSRFGKEV